LWEAVHRVTPPNGVVEQPLDGAARELERLIGRKGRRTDRDEQQEHGDARDRPRSQGRG
jgi:hypothetical protein